MRQLSGDRGAGSSRGANKNPCAHKTATCPFSMALIQALAVAEEQPAKFLAGTCSMWMQGLDVYSGNLAIKTLAGLYRVYMNCFLNIMYIVQCNTNL